LSRTTKKFSPHGVIFRQPVRECQPAGSLSQTNWQNKLQSAWHCLRQNAAFPAVQRFRFQLISQQLQNDFLLITPV
jgi:hypothetical protein